MKALYGGCCLLCNFLLYATDISDASWAAGKNCQDLACHKMKTVKKKWILAVGTVLS